MCHSPWRRRLAYTYAYSHGYSYSYGYSHGNPNSYGQTDAYTADRTDTKASSDSAAEALIDSDRLSRRNVSYHEFRATYAKRI